MADPDSQLPMEHCRRGLGRDPARLYARFVESTTLRSIPADVAVRARHHILDAIGVGLVAATLEFAHRALTATAALAGSGGTVPIIGLPVRLPPRDAAMMNGILCHGLDFDDTHSGGIIHPTVSVFPAALSAGLQAGASIGDMILAYVVGLEVAVRVAAVTPGGFHQNGFHPTAVAGVFGCALAAGQLFRLSERELVHAQGIALSFASGSLEFLEAGAWTKRLHPGWAAQAGITAAALAKQGFTGPERPYCGRFGLYRLFSGGIVDELDIELTSRSLGSTWELLSTAIKPYPVCHLAHGAIEAALMLHANGAALPQEIESVDVILPADVVDIICEPAGSKKRPQNDYDARFSVQFLVAAALTRGKMTLAELEPEVFRDSAILLLADRVGYSIDPASPFPRAYSGEVVLRLRDGTERRHRQEVNLGAADRPLTTDDIVRKFFENTSISFSNRKAVKVERAVLAADFEAPLSHLAETLGGSL